MLFSGGRTHTHTHTQIFSQYSGISSHSFGRSYTMLIVGIGKGFLTNLLFTSQKSLKKRKVLSFLGIMKGRLAYHHHLQLSTFPVQSRILPLLVYLLFLHQTFKTTFKLRQNLLAFCCPLQRHFLCTSVSKICIFFCLSILNVLLLYLTCNYFTFCLHPLVLPHLFFD